MVHRNGRWACVAAIFGLTWTACGGGTTDPPPAPPPPPPPPPPGGVSPAISLDMGLGDVVTLTDPAEVRAFELLGGGEARDYEIIVQSASETFGASTNMQLLVRADGASGNAVPIEQPRLHTDLGKLDRELALRASSFQLETRLRRSMREEMERQGARPVRMGLDRNVSASVAAASARPPVLGQMLTFSLGVDSNLNANCTSPTSIDGEVMFVGQNFTVVEDVALAGEFTAADYQEIGQQLDTVVFPTDVAYFGSPADIDNNGTVIALITAEVNKLTPASSASIIAGFFFSGDLMTKASCPASNEGEIFYLIGPDPGSQFGPEIDLDFANTLARTTVAHEFLHLLNTQQRIVIGNGTLADREDAWLDEGLAHLAEELAGLATAGFGTRTNLSLAQLTASQVQLDAFNDFHLLNMDRFARFLQGGCPSTPGGPAGAMALGDGLGGDPGGTESLRFRGFAYGFVRWLGDHFGPAGNGTLPGSREEMLFRELSSGGSTHARGIANVERAVQTIGGSNMQWEDLIALYMASLVSDDNAPAGADPLTQFLTWNMRGVYQGLNQSNLGMNCPFDRGFPLFPAVVTLNSSTNQTVAFTANASTGRFISVNSPATSPDAVLEVTTDSGASLPASARGQVTIIRTR